MTRYGAAWCLISLLLFRHGAADGEAEQEKSLGQSRTVTPKDGATVGVRVPISDANRNLLSVVSFPDPVEHVVSSWNPKDLSVEHESGKIFLKLFSKVEGHVDVITAAGIHYRLYLTPAAAGSEFDSSIVVKRGEGNSSASTASDVDTKSASGTSASGAVELAKAMRLGQVPEGATVRDGQGEVLLADADLEARLLWVYETARFRGIVLLVKNLSREEAVLLDPSRFRADDLVLLGAREMVLRPGKSTRVYLVFWK